MPENEQKPNRTKIEDLEPSETELTTEEARKVQGGKARPMSDLQKITDIDDK